MCGFSRYTHLHSVGSGPVVPTHTRGRGTRRVCARACSKADDLRPPPPLSRLQTVRPADELPTFSRHHPEAPAPEMAAERLATVRGHLQPVVGTDRSPRATLLRRYPPDTKPVVDLCSPSPLPPVSPPTHTHTQTQTPAALDLRSCSTASVYCTTILGSLEAAPPALFEPHTPHTLHPKSPHPCSPLPFPPKPASMAGMAYTLDDTTRGVLSARDRQFYEDNGFV